ncbi:MAG: site-2 protease family protein [Actinomycetota bacterium]|nr:site-2 protease family protein [Actinomycetota bacterium]
MFGKSWRLGRIAGVEIRIDRSWILVAALVTYFLYLELSVGAPELGTALAGALAVGAAAVFFGSVLTHEMAHALVARARGIRVHGITLFLFGGATHARVESRGPWDEFVVSVVGPVTSLGLAGALWWLGTVTEDVLLAPAPELLRYLGFVNVILAVFNLLPGFPLDGGRVLRSAVWRVTGSIHTATRVATLGGMAVGYLLVAAGLVLMIRENAVGSLWFVFIGWFLAQAARRSRLDLEARRRLEEAEAKDLMSADADSLAVAEGNGTMVVEAGTPMAEVAARLRGQTGTANLLVVRDGSVIGVLWPEDVARWARTVAELNE